MKKVVYAVTRYGKTGQTRVTGLGYITDTDLIIACQSKENKPYISIPKTKNEKIEKENL